MRYCWESQQILYLLNGVNAIKMFEMMIVKMRKRWIEYDNKVFIKLIIGIFILMALHVIMPNIDGIGIIEFECKC